MQVPIGRWNAVLKPRIDMMIAVIALVVRGMTTREIKGHVKVNVVDMVVVIAGNLGKIGSEEIGETSDTNGETSAWTDTTALVDAPKFKLRRGEVKLTQS